MKRRKLILAALLAAALLCTAAPLPASAASFADVPGDAWYAGAVSDLVGKGVVNGTSAAQFSPGKPLTRAAFAAMLAKTELRQEDLNQYSFQGKFKDVSEKHWSNRFVNWAVENGIVNGYGNGTFCPDKPVTRQEMAVMVVNFSKATARQMPAVNTAVTFSDGSSIARYALASVQSCQRAGVINGYSDGTFRPKDQATRAEAAFLYSNFLKNCLPGNYTVVRKRVFTTPVKAVLFDPANYAPGLLLGRDLVDGSEAPASLVERSGAVIAMNAAFFDMSSYMPLGTLIKEGRVVTVFDQFAPAKSALVLDSTGKFSIQNFTTNHVLSLTKEDGTESEIKGVTVNKWPSGEKDGARILFTRDWGHTLCFEAVDAVTLDEEGNILSVEHNKDVSIPEHGYVLAQKSRREYEGDFFDSCQVGGKINIQRTYEGADSQDLVLSIGAGPRIVKDGAAYGNQETYRAEGFSASNITQYNALRICLGIKADGTLVAVSANTTLEQLSKIMVSFGCQDAINFDGGGSANLYVNGCWLVGPQDRKLNNMLYFKAK